jgi:hypothetical protein
MNREQEQYLLDLTNEEYTFGTTLLKLGEEYGSTPIGKQLAFIFDMEVPVLLKHGEPTRVKEYFDKMYTLTKNKDLHYIMIEYGDIDIQEINKMLSTTGYITKPIKDAIDDFYQQRKHSEVKGI